MSKQIRIDCTVCLDFIGPTVSNIPVGKFLIKHNNCTREKIDVKQTEFKREYARKTVKRRRDRQFKQPMTKQEKGEKSELIAILKLKENTAKREAEIANSVVYLSCVPECLLFDGTGEDYLLTEKY